ncbi:glycoside hydrolase family 2 TIM barrel-domain containing protein [Zunongwangia sp. F363]|uniref:Glycoside hydrolase family 2 TIM barrel-domain containing protein n=1 Tax=Autumnicola tepida TaxID=3075595 RepID=A0ABU3CCP1_9FLAO|nr:glycoside hydrolase family 2 TIM barrel-domain containing protein [Zunongwangia sp. F363]MDT0644108.1 glycoside hydrolase family 2 TIM barrel-domain containing protein [Zunongwangia sp. F363]
MNMRTLFSYLFLLGLILNLPVISFSQELIQNLPGRETLSLNGRWNYIIDPYKMGYLDYRQQPFDQSESGKGGFYDNITAKEIDSTQRVEYDFSQSPTLKVPGDWNSQEERLELYEGTLWYKRDFHVDLQESKRYFLHFGAVNYEAHVYLNGKKLGVHKGGFTPFQFEVTGELKNGKNDVVLMVDNSRKKDEVPTVNTDWWNYGGITRDVDLIITPETFIHDYKVQLANNDMKMISGFVQLDGNQKQGQIKVEIPELKISKTISVNNSGKANFDISVKNVDYWSPKNPKLYEVKISTEKDEIKDQIGFRTIETKGQDILLNDNSIFLKGISIHDENPFVEGRLRNEGDMRMMLSWAKELGCNFVRLAHYTHNEKMLRLADEMGLMVWAEIPVYWTISWENMETYENAENQLASGILRDKNRASIIIWSVGNETPVTEARNDFMEKLIARARQLDDTRLIAAALEVETEGNVAVVNDPLGEKLDLASFNEYAGWYWGEPENISQYTFDIKFNKPVVITEFGGGALGGFHADKTTMWSEEHQEYLYEQQLKMLDKIDGLRGMTPWILVDFKSPRRNHPVYQNFWNRKGIISETGEKKKAFYILQDYYQNIN